MQTKLPYGLSDFRRVREENYYYIDKTNFIAKIENDADFLFSCVHEDLANHLLSQC